MSDDIVIEVSRDELELIRTSLRTQGTWYLKGEFIGMATATADLQDKISNIIIEVSGKVRS